MPKVVLYMSMSVDGFIAGPDDGPDHGLGVGGERLHDWLRPGGVDPRSHRPVDGPGAAVFDELMATGAVIAGRRTFDHAGGWAGDHHDGVPIFVLTRAAPAEPAPDPRATSPMASSPASRRPGPRPVAATSCCTVPRPRRSACVPACWRRWSCS
jgi:dihydrofolate reductase